MAEVSPSYPQMLYQPEAGACQVLLIRHGQSAPYVAGQPFPLVDGHGDPQLTDLGHHQAGLVGTRLAEERVTAVYASTLTRTQQTADPLAMKLGLTVNVEADLREVFLGHFEGGLLRKMSAENHPAVMAMRVKREWGELPGAETNAELVARTVRVVDQIAADHPNELVAAFCHGGVIGAVLAHAADTSPFAFNGARHTSISHLVINPTGWVIRSFNDGAHAGMLTVDHQLPVPGVTRFSSL